MAPSPFPSSAAAGSGERDAGHAPSTASPPLLSPLESEVLDEYATLVENLRELSDVLADLAARPAPQILDALRGLERKTTSVFTLLKASVYSIVLQQEIADADGVERGGGLGQH